MRVAIVGAGPAGAMAAIRLARAGAAVTIFDPSHPREKPCGGGVTGRALALIADVVDVAALPALVVSSAVVEAPGSTGVDEAERAAVALVARDISPASSLIVLRRALFDRALLDAAIRCGAQLIPAQVLDVASTAREATVRTADGEHTADFLLGADGANSVVRKKLARPFVRNELSIAAGYFVHGARAPAITIQSIRRQPGYLWSFPRPDHLAVGICAPANAASTSGSLQRQSREWIESHGLGQETRLEPYAWPIPSVGFSRPDRLRTAGPRWMLLGDAAGLVDPLTREGIYYALLSGMWASDAVAQANGRRPPHDAYSGRVRDEMYPELNRAARMSRLFFSPGFSRLLVTALKESEPIREIFADLVAGAQPYRGLRRRLLRTREWALAGRALQLVVQ